jgi:hypothetical protein
MWSSLAVYARPMMNKKLGFPQCNPHRLYVVISIFSTNKFNTTHFLFYDWLAGNTWAMPGNAWDFPLPGQCLGNTWAIFLCPANQMQSKKDPANLKATATRPWPSSLREMPGQCLGNFLLPSQSNAIQEGPCKLEGHGHQAVAFKFAGNAWAIFLCHGHQAMSFKFAGSIFKYNLIGYYTFLCPVAGHLYTAVFTRQAVFTSLRK